MKFIVAGIIGGVSALFAGTIIAIIMQPHIAPYFGNMIRNESDGLLFSSLVSGYFVIGFALAYLVPKCNKMNGDILPTLRFGMIMGLAVFFGDHLITAGWSHLAFAPMAISGLMDALSVVVASWAVKVVYCWNK